MRRTTLDTRPSGDLAIVVAHGFTGRSGPARRAARGASVFAQRAAVVTFSFRGHGGSGGRSTVGDREVLDLAAAVAWARSLGHDRVVTVGFSMGGSVVLRHAALYGAAGQAHGGRTEAHTDAVVSVSAPARWYYRGTAPMRRLHWVVTQPAGRLVGRYGLRTRIHHRDWDPVPLSPVESVPLIAPDPAADRARRQGRRTSRSTTRACWRTRPAAAPSCGWSGAWATPRTRRTTNC